MAEWKCVNIDHVPFCEKCHSILEPPDAVNLLRCSYCDYSITAKLRERKSVRTFDTELKKFVDKQMKKKLMSINENKDNDSDEEDLLDSDKKLRERLKKQIMGSGGGRKIIRQDCLECGAKKQAYEARQIRSVDEGQTLFFECLECGHKSVLHS
eukprot:403238_1